MERDNENNEPQWRTWLKRAGLAGFLFFLIKGLIWIGFFVAAYYAAKKA